MPVLMSRLRDVEKTAITDGGALSRPIGLLQPAKAAAEFLRQCGNQKCRSGWMKLWRSRQGPVLDGEWACSPACMREIVHAAVSREAGERTVSPTAHQHRVPFGLVLLSRGIITQEQLKKALDAQRKAGVGRLGEWLLRQKAIDEEHIAHALSAQWNCPVLTGVSHDCAAMSSAFPRLLVDTFGAIPIRMAGRAILYVAFEDRIDRCLVLAIERMLDLKVEPGVLRDSEFSLARQAILRAPFPKTRLLEVADMRGLVHAVAAVLEERKPARSRILRAGDYFWLRMWRIPAATGGRTGLPAAENVEDLVCSLAAR